MLRILHDTKIDFIRLWRRAALLTALFILPGLALIAIRGYTYSIEFTGGTLFQVRFDEAASAADVRAALADAGLTDVEIATFGSDREYVLRAQDESLVEEQAQQATTVATRIQASLDERFGAGSYEVIRAEAVGPRVGDELRQQALVALLIAFGLTLIYLAWRFEWRFSLAAVLATVHDIFATLAFMKYLDLEISLFVVGSILTVIGYSMNDKVVVFDRVRENLRISRRESLYDVLNRSVNETLPRTVMTGTTTLAALLSLLIFGGEVIRPFAWVLIFGILIGTFSSIYVASPLLLWIERKWPSAAGEKASVAAGRAKAAPGTAPAATPAPAQRRGSRPASTR